MGAKVSRKKYTGKEDDMLIIKGVHPDDIRTPKVQYSFIASDFLVKQYPCVGDIVCVYTKRGIKHLYVTDMCKWKEGDFVPERIAKALYQGSKWIDFEYELEE